MADENHESPEGVSKHLRFARHASGEVSRGTSANPENAYKPVSTEINNPEKMGTIKKDRYPRKKHAPGPWIKRETGD